MRWAGNVARMGDERKVYKVLLGKPSGKGPLRNLRRRSEWILRSEIAWGGGVECIQLARDRDRWQTVVNTVMNLQVLTPRN
jgi:hypothetical protein